MIYRQLLLLSINFVSYLDCNSQIIRPLSVGEKLPSEIWEALPKKNNTKLVILDFWSTSCTSCFALFPEIIKLQKKFDDQLQIVLVNNYENDQQVELRLNKINEKRKQSNSKPILIPEFPTINGDSTLTKYFPHQGVPHHVWINNDKVVIAITGGHNATEEHVKAVLEGKNINLAETNNLEGYDPTRDGWMRPNHPELPLPAFFSGFMNFFSGIGSGTYTKVDTANKTIRNTYRNWSILEFYQYAFNKYGIRVLQESKIKSDYDTPEDNNSKDDWQSRNLFTYETILPLRDIKDSRKFMQADLNRFFGSLLGISGNIEKRSVKCLVLKASNKINLKSVGGKKDFKHGGNLFSWNNYPFSSIINHLTDVLESQMKVGIFINEIKFSGNVDFQLTDDLDFNKVNEQLKKYGIELVNEYREADVLILKDRESMVSTHK